MADFAKGGSKEKDSKDKSLHGLMIALAMAGTIAGVAILFAYAASDGSAFNAGAATNVAATPPEQEPAVVENVSKEPVYVKVKYANSTEEAEKPVNANTINTTNTTAEVPTDEVEKPAYVNDTQNNNEDNSLQTEPQQQPAQPNNDGLGDIDLEKIIPKRLLDLLDDDHGKHNGKD